jgi:RPA family protein
MLVEEQKKRNVAFKLRVGDIMKAKPIMQEGRLIHIELGDKKIIRVNLIANVVDKFSTEGEKKYASITLDDASGQIRVKAFGDDIILITNTSQGDTVQIIGNLREYNNEIYIMPEVVKKVDPKWLLVRKLEIQKTRKVTPTASNAPIKDIILEKIKGAEKEGGAEVDELIMSIEAQPEMINAEITKLLEEGLIYEPRPGRLRYLG